ncbi:malonyl-ACP O-methyltransferase BioC [Endothiovibrio diazotrophicus]
MSEPHHIDKTLVRAAFSRAAPTYDRAAVLQKEVASRLVERLDFVKLSPQRIYDLGCGTGRVSAALRERYPAAEVVALDFALPMLQAAQRRSPGLAAVCGDLEALPLAGHSAELILSNLTLQWCLDLEGSLRGLLRVARPGGLLMFTTFGPDTLRELRAAWAQVDGRSHVNAFTDLHDVGDALMRAGWAEPVVDQQTFTLTYDEVSGLMRDLKEMGAHNVTAGRAHGLTGRARLRAMADAYERFRSDGRLPATYEVVYGHAWATDGASAARPDEPATYPLDRLRRAIRTG